MKKRWLTPSEALNRSFTKPIVEEIDTFDDLIQGESTRRLGFHIGNIGLLIPQRITSELTDLVSICPIPNTATWLAGLINLRGNLVPVFDLGMLLDLEKNSPKKQMLLILGQGEMAGAVIIDDLPVHITLSDGDILDSLPPLPDVIKSFTPVGYEKNGEVWFDFDNYGFFQSLATKVTL